MHIVGERLGLLPNGMCYPHYGNGVHTGAISNGIYLVTAIK